MQKAKAPGRIAHARTAVILAMDRKWQRVKRNRLVRQANRKHPHSLYPRDQRYVTILLAPGTSAPRAKGGNVNIRGLISL